MFCIQISFVGKALLI